MKLTSASLSLFGLTLGLSQAAPGLMRTLSNVVEAVKSSETMSVSTLLNLVEVSILDSFPIGRIPNAASAGETLITIIQPAVVKATAPTAKNVTGAVPVGNTKYTVNLTGYMGISEASSAQQLALATAIAKFINKEAIESPFFKSRFSLLCIDSAKEQPQNLILKPVYQNGTIGAPYKPVSLETIDDGYFSTKMDIWLPSQSVSALVVSPEGDTNKYSQIFPVVERKGYSIVSDIDDTIKVTGTLNSKEVVKKTFVEKFEAIPGMPKLYQEWYKGLIDPTAPNNAPAFHYISGGFTKLLPIYQTFIEKEAKFPRGEIRMDKLNIKAVLDSSRIYSFKLNNIQNIMESEPGRKFVLVGDSTQSDPEVYGKLLSTYPDQVACVFIRMVSGFNPKKEERGNSPSRFEQAFSNVTQGVKSPKLLIYKDAAELPSSATILSGKCR